MCFELHIYLDILPRSRHQQHVLFDVHLNMKFGSSRSSFSIRKAPAMPKPEFMFPHGWISLPRPIAKYLTYMADSRASGATRKSAGVPKENLLNYDLTLHPPCVSALHLFLTSIIICILPTWAYHLPRHLTPSSISLMELSCRLTCARDSMLCQHQLIHNTQSSWMLHRMAIAKTVQTRMAV